MTPKTLCVLCVLCGCLAFAQNYRCDWSVNGIGGGEMAGGNYKCASTVGQTAAGLITGSNYWALIGFWQPEEQVGVREQAYSPGQGPFATRLYSPFPTPAVRSVTIRYTLDATHQTRLQLHDLTGRVVRTLRASSMERGAYSVTWNGTDDRGRILANGVYFVRMMAGEYRATEKVVLQK